MRRARSVRTAISCAVVAGGGRCVCVAARPDSASKSTMSAPPTSAANRGDASVGGGFMVQSMRVARRCSHTLTTIGPWTGRRAATAGSLGPAARATRYGVCVNQFVLRFDVTKLVNVASTVSTWL